MNFEKELLADGWQLRNFDKGTHHFSKNNFFFKTKFNVTLLLNEEGVEICFREYPLSTTHTYEFKPFPKTYTELIEKVDEYFVETINIHTDELHEIRVDLLWSKNEESI